MPRARLEVNFGVPGRSEAPLKGRSPRGCHPRKGRAAAGPHYHISQTLRSSVRLSGRPSPCGHPSPSGQKQIKAHTLQIGDLPRLARRLELSAALIEKSVRPRPISLSPSLQRNLQNLGPPGPSRGSAARCGWARRGGEGRSWG